MFSLVDDQQLQNLYYMRFWWESQLCKFIIALATPNFICFCFKSCTKFRLERISRWHIFCHRHISNRWNQPRFSSRLLNAIGPANSRLSPIAFKKNYTVPQAASDQYGLHLASTRSTPMKISYNRRIHNSECYKFVS